MEDSETLQNDLRDNALRVFGLDKVLADACQSTNTLCDLADTRAGRKDRRRLKKCNRTTAAGNPEVDTQATMQKADGEERSPDAGSAPLLDDGTDELDGAALQQLTLTETVAHYRCHKCRYTLFKKTDIFVHSAEAGGIGSLEALCNTVLFLKQPSAVETGIGFVVVGTHVECIKCTTKLGRYNCSDVLCTCGVNVPGPTAGFTPSKVDFVSTESIQALAQRSLSEAKEANEQNELYGQPTHKKKRKQKKGYKFTTDDGVGFSRNLRRGGTAPKGATHGNKNGR